MVVSCTARIVVRYQHDKSDEGEVPEEHWGTFDFEYLPRNGDMIHLLYDDSYQDLLVTSVVHSGISNPKPNTGLRAIDDDKPSTQIITDWKWSD